MSGFDDDSRQQQQQNQEPPADTGIVRIERKNRKTGIVSVKDYATVALRINQFWANEKHAGWSIITKIITADEEKVIIRCRIFNEAGKMVSSGHAEEIRGSSDINTTSALENAETSAIGRALFAMGIGGTSFASAEEVIGAQQKQDEFAELKKFFIPLFEKASQKGLNFLGDCWAKPSLLKSFAPEVGEEGWPKCTAIEVKRALKSELPRFKEIASRVAPPQVGQPEPGSKG